MEVTREKAIVMNQRGQFDEIDATPSMKVGNEIEYGDNNTMKVVSALCMVLITITSLFGFQLYGNYHDPVSFVALDINPAHEEKASVEFTLNAYDQIITAVSTSDAATLVLAGNDYKGLSIDEAFNLFLMEANELGYISHDVAVLVSVAMDEVTEGYALEDRLSGQINQFFTEQHILGVVVTDENNSVLRVAAENEGMSASKYRLVNQVANNTEVTKEEAAAMSIQDLNKIVESKNIAPSKSQEELLQEKEQLKEQVAIAREAEAVEPKEENFGGVLADYQNNMSEEELQKIYDAVNESLKPNEETPDTDEEVIKPLVCTNLEDGSMEPCPEEQEICFDEVEGIYYVCPLDQDLCISDTSEYRFICPLDKQICTDENDNKFVCPIQIDSTEQEETTESTDETTTDETNQEQDEQTTDSEEPVDDSQQNETVQDEEVNSDDELNIEIQQTVNEEVSNNQEENSNI